MNIRPVIQIALIVILPLAALGWAAWQIAENEQLVVQQRYRRLMQDRLQDINVTVNGYFSDVQREIQKVLEINNFETAELRRISRQEPRLLQTFVLSAEGELMYPNPMNDLNANEQDFLLQTSRMFTGQDLRSAVLRIESRQNKQSSVGLQSQSFDNQGGVKQVPLLSKPQPAIVQESTIAQVQQPPVLLQQQSPSQSLSLNQGSRASVKQSPQPNLPSFPSVLQVEQSNGLTQFQQSSGWFLWYWDRGLNLISWQRRPSGQIVGGALVRARWMSDLIARLPETIHSEVTDSSESDQAANRLATRIQLVNASAATVYQWGSYEPESGQQALCEVPLAEPLSSWRLKCFVPIEELTSGTGRSAYFGLFSSFVATVVIVAATAVFFLRSYSRDMREAQQQVSFVNQVSHELKTPLTNIRMYAELLESDLNYSDETTTEKPRQRLQIILSEGQRLTRLIGNVLTFARQQKDSLQPHLTEACPDQVIQHIIDRFHPALVDQQVEVKTQLNSPNSVKLDCDFLEQVLGNLINNVEKYAATGGQICINSRQEADRLILDVKDCGPGIPSALADHVFQPFARVTNDVSYAAGTGIGLSIARELARRHGGDLLLKESPTGCWFQAVLKCETPS